MSKLTIPAIGPDPAWSDRFSTCLLQLRPKTKGLEARRQAFRMFKENVDLDPEAAAARCVSRLEVESSSDGREQNP